MMIKNENSMARYPLFLSSESLGHNYTEKKYITCKAPELWGRIRNSPIRIEFDKFATIKIFCRIIETAKSIRNMTSKALGVKWEWIDLTIPHLTPPRILLKDRNAFFPFFFFFNKISTLAKLSWILGLQGYILHGYRPALKTSHLMGQTIRKLKSREKRVTMNWSSEPLRRAS